MKNRAATLLEMIAAFVIMVILLGVGFYAFRDMPENARARVCETNLKVLKNSLDMYMLDHETAPANLTAIPARYITASYARLMREKGAWKIRFAYWLAFPREQGIAYAKPFSYTLGRQDIGLLTCPKDRTPPDAAGEQVSYGLFNDLAGMNTRTYQEISGTATLQNSTVVIGDSESPTIDGTPDGLEKRHYNYGKGVVYGQGITRDNQIVKGEAPIPK